MNFPTFHPFSWECQSSQLTNSYFSEGLFYHQPEQYCAIHLDFMKVMALNFLVNTSSNLESAGTKFHLTDPKSATNPLIVLISLPNGSIIKYQMEKYRYHWYSFMIDSPIYGPLDNSIIYHYFSPCITEVLICCWTCAKPLILMLVQVIANKSGEDVWAPELYRGPYGFHKWGYPTISYDLGVPPFQWNVHIGNLPKPFMTIWGTSTMAGESFFQEPQLFVLQSQSNRWLPKVSHFH